MEDPNKPQEPQQPVQPAPPPIASSDAPIQKIVSDRIHVMVRNRRQILFDDDVKAVTSINDTGLFDVLPEHSNFISVLKDSIKLHKMDGTEEVITLKNGVMKVKDSGVKCYIDLLTTVINQEENKPIPPPAQQSEQQKTQG
jgi:hypothetical protein